MSNAPPEGFNFKTNVLTATLKELIKNYMDGKKPTGRWKGMTVLKTKDHHIVKIGDKVVIPFEKMDATLNGIYDNPEMGLASADKMWQRVKANLIGISKENVKDFVKNQSTDQIQRPRIRAKVNKPILSRAPNQTWHADLTEVTDAGLNNGVEYLLCVVDGFS
jgi:hypothetical protein